MDAATIQRIEQEMLDVRFAMPKPAKDSEYWLFGGPAASLGRVRVLPKLLGLRWAWQGDELVVDFLEGPDSYQSDLLGWSDLAAEVARGHRLMVRWAGFDLPLRVVICPGLGVRAAIEHLNEAELRRLHQSVVREFAHLAIEDVSAYKVLIGCDTRGIMDHDPEQVFSSDDRGLPLLCPDYVLASNSIAQSAFCQDSRQTLRSYDGLFLIAG